MGSAGGYAQMGMAGLGGTLGGIGDIIGAASYKKPKIPQATGPELRLRQLAQDQLLGGGQQLLGGTALYNQLAPILMSQLPGMSYVPGSSDGGGGGGGSGPSSNLSSYQQQLQDYQQAQQRQQQLISLKAQRKGAKGAGAKKPITQQIKALKRDIKSNPTTAQEERQAYMAGSQPGSYDVRMGSPATAQSSLSSINDLLAGLGFGGTGGGTGSSMQSPSDLSSIFSRAGQNAPASDISMPAWFDRRFTSTLSNPDPSGLYRDPDYYNRNYGTF